MASAPQHGPRLFGRGTRLEARRISDILRKETNGGILLLVGAVAALVWANSPWVGNYESLRAFTFGPEALHLNLSAATWAADGLLAIFFFVAGLELKREFVAGDLHEPRRAAVPIAAAVGGVIPQPRCTCSSTSARPTGRLRAGRSRPPPTSHLPWPCWR